MADIKYYDVILKPVITEKSMAAMAEKKYTFLATFAQDQDLLRCCAPLPILSLLGFHSFSRTHR